MYFLCVCLEYVGCVMCVACSYSIVRCGGTSLMYGCVYVVRYGVCYLWYVCAVWGCGLPGMCGVCDACCMSGICGMALMCVKSVVCVVFMV